MYYILVVGITLTSWKTKWAEGVLGLQAVRRQFTSLGHLSKGDRHWRYRLQHEGLADTDYSIVLAKTMLGRRHPMSAYGVLVVQISTLGVLNFG